MGGLPGMPTGGGLVLRVGELEREVDEARQAQELADAPPAGQVRRPWFEAQVVATAPAGEAIDAGKNLYAVKQVRSKDAAGDSGDGISYEFVTGGLHVMATNEGEASGSHELAEEDVADAAGREIVQVYSLLDAQSPRRGRYYFRRGVAAGTAWAPFTDTGRSHRTVTHYQGAYDYYAADDTRHTGHGYYAWAVDGAGDAVRQTALEGATLNFYAVGVDVIVQTPAVVNDHWTTACFYLDWVTEPFKPGAVVFGAPPATNNFRTLPNVIASAETDEAATASLDEVIQWVSGVAPVNLYGVRLRFEIVSRPAASISYADWYPAGGGVPTLWWRDAS